MSVVIESGATVQIAYTLKDDAGAVLDSNEGQAPLTYVHGQREIIPGLERALDGLQAGDARQVTVAVDDGYGPVDPSAVAEVPRQTVPQEALVPGTELLARRQDGATRAVRVKEVRESTVVLDLNHPLAGRTLHFDVRVVDVAPAA
jgi:FKBP-type peptidyl-prolyl cis-trans isomerase SlyD